MRTSEKMEKTDRLIGGLLEELCGRTLNDTSVLPLILCGDRKKADDLRLLDFLRQSVLTSLQFGQYRRAVWYLQAFFRV